MKVTRLTGIDIETISIPTNNGWKICPIEIGLYNPISKEYEDIFISPYFQANLTRKEKGIYFYSEDRYKNINGRIMDLEKAKEYIEKLNFNILFGHNIVKFDIPVLKSVGINVKYKKIVDTYLEAGKTLPLSYYLTLKKWRETYPQYEDKFFTKKGSMKMTAEAIYCFISGNPDFQEDHTAVKDCMIEYEIYKYESKRSRGEKKTNGNWKSILKDYFSRFKYFQQ